MQALLQVTLPTSSYNWQSMRAWHAGQYIVTLYAALTLCAADPRSVTSFGWQNLPLSQPPLLDGESAVTLAMYGLDFKTQHPGREHGRLRAALGKHLGELHCQRAHSNA